MQASYDVVIIGGGIAGVSAALSCRSRGKSVAVIANGEETSSLYKAERIANYPGIPAASGKEICAVLSAQLAESGAELVRGRALSVTPIGAGFGVAVGSEFCGCAAVILAAGITREKLYPGEGEFLGRGVSYCATCDGMLYRGKAVAVIGAGREAAADADFLESIGCKVTLRIDGQEGDVIGEAVIGKTGKVEKYKTFSTKVSNAQGVHDLYLCFSNTEGDIRLDYWNFQK